MNFQEKIEAFVYADNLEDRKYFLDEVCNTKTFNNRIHCYCKRQYKRYGAAQLLVAYKNVDLEWFEDILMSRIKEKLLSSFSTSKNTEGYEKQSFLAYCNLCQKELFVGIFLELAQVRYPKITKAYLSAYVRIRKAGFELTENTNKEINAVTGISCVTIDNLRYVLNLPTEEKEAKEAEAAEREALKLYKKTRFFYDGVYYRNLKEISLKYDLNYDKLRKYASTMPLKEAIEKVKNEVVVWKGINGDEYSSGEKMCQAYNITYNTYRQRKNRGYSHEDALLGKLNSRQEGYRPTVHKKIWVGLDGKEYKSCEKMCNVYGVKVNTYYARVSMGYSHEDALLGNLSAS